ncbi:unnamed protein product, partial [Heterotrigona itama]
KRWEFYWRANRRRMRRYDAYETKYKLRSSEQEGREKNGRVRSGSGGPRTAEQSPPV